MSSIYDRCDQCGARLTLKYGALEPFCPDCSDLVGVLDVLRYPGRLHYWLERVIDRRVQKALAERRLP